MSTLKMDAPFTERAEALLDIGIDNLMAAVHTGAFSNYVDRILPFFWPHFCVDSFYTLSVDKKGHFLPPSPLSSCPRSY